MLIKQASDLNCSTINQMVMHRLAEAVFDAQVAAAREHYRRRRDAMLAALERAHAERACSWTRPQGGLFVWVRLPDRIDAAELLERAVDEARVAFVPGARVLHDGRGRNTMRLSYSLPSEAADRRRHRPAGQVDLTRPTPL